MLRIEPARVDALAREAVDTGQVIDVHTATDDESKSPWLKSPSDGQTTALVKAVLPHEVRVVFGQRLFVEVNGLPPALIKKYGRAT